MQVWLRTNQRVMAAGLVFPALAIVIGCLLAFATADMLRWTGAILVLAGGAYSLLLVTLLQRPLLAYRDGHLLVYLKSGEPERVPIELVEVFFRGEGPVRPDDDDSPNASNIVVRLAERAEDFKHRDVKPALGHWCDGYITIRGMWCEPINVALMERLNRTLVQTHRARKAEASSEA